MNYNNNKFKPKNTGIKFEDIVPDFWYALTLNPKDLRLGNSGKLLPLIHRDINTLRHMVGKSKFQLHLEASPLGRLHYHGYVKFSDDYVDTLRLLQDLENYGTFCLKIPFIQEDENGVTWEEYIIKQRHIWEPIFKDTIHGYPFRIECTGNLPS